MPLFNSPEENVSKVETNIEAFATPPPTFTSMLLLWFREYPPGTAIQKAGSCAVF